MIKEENYVCIQGWMCNKLKLKGNKLIIYAIIYGFCQDHNSCFNGSLEYLQQWTNSTRQGVIKVLKELLHDNLIRKEECYPNNKYYLYNSNLYVNSVSDDVNKVNLDSKQSLQNNIDNNINNIIDNNANNTCFNENKEDNYLQAKVENETIEKVISHLNSICKTNYKSNSKSAKKFIKARLKDGFSLQDFITVIEYKYKEWGEKPSKFSNGQLSSIYLRPSTLFGTKMEEYLHQAWMVESSEGFNNNNVKSVKKSNERSNKIY